MASINIPAKALLIYIDMAREALRKELEDNIIELQEEYEKIFEELNWFQRIFSGAKKDHVFDMEYLDIRFKRKSMKLDGIEVCAKANPEGEVTIDSDEAALLDRYLRPKEENDGNTKTQNTSDHISQPETSGPSEDVSVAVV